MKGRVAALIELNAGFNPILTGRENIYNQAALLGFSKEETDTKFDAIVEFSEIGDFLDMPVQNYSSGMKVRLGFAVAAQMEPDILIIDEVLAVGDVAFRFKCLNAIGELMKNAAVVFVTHTMPQVFRICSEVMVLNQGTVTCHGPNLNEGVGIYLSLFRGTTPNISGSGEVRVTGLKIESQDVTSVGLGESCRTRHGGDVGLRTHLEFSPGIESARLQFLLWNAEMLPIIDIMGEDLLGFHFNVPLGGKVVVEARIGRLELNSGKYSLSIIVNCENQRRTYCQYDNAAFIQIDAATDSGANVLPSACWSVDGTSRV